ncbi:uncharacterized protein LOC6641315 [Drosophila willistoni]|uniref:uncharacterized protein LOC6641315 n=1 Tax=Drosophila willistoni TaxID=7260 RepID=UPI00017D72A6|nr:uncharacterized protein LOC6641315 [Drosophila willistoni]
MPVTPGTPDSSHMILGAAAFVVHERRQPNKSLMNCFRDRTPSSASLANNSSAHVYARSQSSLNGGAITLDAGRPEAVVLLRELRRKPNKLALLKSSSTKDLTRLFADEPMALVSNTSLDSNSSSAGTASPAAARASLSGRTRECCAACSKRWHDLKQRMHTLEQDLQVQTSYNHDLEVKVTELTRQVNDLLQLQETRDRKAAAAEGKQGGGKRIGGGGGGGGSGSGASGGGGVSRLPAWMNLSNWWKSRPSVETLREQHIFFDEPCFDTELELVLKHDQHKTVPRIVVECCDLIEQQYRQSTEPIVGIYRQCGDYNKIQTLRFNIDANDYESLHHSKVDIHTLTGVLKLFLREIKSPLISVNEAKTFIGNPNQWLLTEFSLKLDILKRLIRSLPETNRDTMEYIFGHFNRLTKVPLQQINSETLAISISPSIFHTVPQGAHMQDLQQLLREGETLADCVRIMIEYKSRIFECTADRRRISVKNLKKTLSQPDLLFRNRF